MSLVNKSKCDFRPHLVVNSKEHVWVRTPTNYICGEFKRLICWSITYIFNRLNYNPIF